MNDYETYGPDYDDGSDWSEVDPRFAPFADPGGRSALRAGRRTHPCPTCGRENVLTDADVRLGYQCDSCANADEGYF